MLLFIKLLRNFVVTLLLKNVNKYVFPSTYTNIFENRLKANMIADNQEPDTTQPFIAAPIIPFVFSILFRDGNVRLSIHQFGPD